jgi:hypothetical protein
MENHLYKLVYCSRNRLKGCPVEINAELHGILASARKNNAALGVTGALLYSAGNFAQVLEGPLPSIERLFEVIQRDPRHSEVTVVHSGPTAGRDFPDWSMAFAGSNEPAEMPSAAAAFDSAFAQTEGAGEQMLTTLKELVLCEDDWILLDAA